MSDDKRIFFLANQDVRRAVAQHAMVAPDGWKVTFQQPLRTLDQNAAQWPILTAYSKQLKWPVNGELVQMIPDEWKDVLTAGFRREAVRVAMGLHGGVVMLGTRTSQMEKPTFSEYLEFIVAEAVHRGVVLDRARLA